MSEYGERRGQQPDELFKRFRKAGNTRDLCPPTGKVSLRTKIQRQSLIFVSADPSGKPDASRGPRSKSDHRTQGSLLSLLIIGPEGLVSRLNMGYPGLASRTSPLPSW